MIYVNERPYSQVNGSTISTVASELKPDTDVFIINGFPVAPDTKVEEGDKCWLIKRGEVPGPEEVEHLLYARHTPGVQDKVKNASVAIMGLGGLGSSVSIALARIGVGRLILTDYDVVEPSNLNRQQYFVDQIGLKKTDALQVNLRRVNPYLQIEIHDVVLDEESIPQLFGGVDVLVECFDGADMKAAALRAALLNMQGIGYVGSSGLAGYEANNSIMTRRIAEKVYVVGDGETAAGPGEGLMAPRVGIAAHHQANQVLRILLDLEN